MCQGRLTSVNGGKGLDWGKVYFKLRLLYPNEKQFDEENFGFTPIAVIEEALETARDREIELANLNAIPIAELGVAVVSLGGAKGGKREWFNPYETLLRKREAQQQIDSEVAEIVVELFKQKLLPGWVAEMIDIDMMKLVVD